MSKHIALMSGLVFLLLSAIGFAEMGMIVTP